MARITPARLKKGDEIRVVAPSRTMAPFIEAVKDKAKKNLESLGFKVSFGKYLTEYDDFGSTSVGHRVEDLHDAFSDKNVKCVMTLIGSFNSNQIIRYLDYGLIRSNPKVFCGYSDITVLQHALAAKTDMITYSGPHLFTFGGGSHAVEGDLNYTSDYFVKAVTKSEPYRIEPSEVVAEWSSKEQKMINYKNEGPWVLQQGDAEGTIMGANLCTLNLLQGTEFMPSIKDSILFLEDDEEDDAVHTDRNLQSLLQLPDADSIRGVVFGRFQKGSKITRELLEKIVSTKKELEGLPVIANVDFGHTYPMITFPVGGTASLKASKGAARLEILRH